MLDYILHLDRETFLFLNNLGSAHWDGFWLFVTNKWTSIPLYAVLLYLLYKKLSLTGFLMVLVIIALLITCTDQTANIFKAGFQRLRPCQHPFDDRSIARCGKFGFFSAHAASSMALAVLVGSLLKNYYRFVFVGLLIWSLMLGYSRIYVGVHFPGDVLVGFVVGALYGWLFYRLYRLLMHQAVFLKVKKA